MQKHSNHIMKLQLFAEPLTLEQLQQQMITFQEKQTELETSNATLTEQLAEKTKREKELEEHNQKLFLKITNKSKEEITSEKQQKDDEIQEMSDYVGKDVFDILSDKEKDKLKIIMNGEDE